MRKSILIVLLLGSTLTFAQEKVRIACVGNSITYGAKIENREQNSYHARLACMLEDNYDVRNFGRSATSLLKKGDLP
jgi:sialate O-acetylesterase